MKYLSIVIGAVVATAVMLKAALVPAASAPTMRPYRGIEFKTL